MSVNRLDSKSRPRTITRYDVAFFINDMGGVRWSDLLKEFVEKESEQHISRQRLSDYLKELCDEGLVNKTIDRRALLLRQVWRVYPIYEVPKSRRKRLAESTNSYISFLFLISSIRFLLLFGTS